MSDGLEEVQSTDRHGVRSIPGHVERHSDVRLSGEVVHSGGLDLVHEPVQKRRIGNVAVVQVEVHGSFVRVLKDVSDATGIEEAGPTDKPVHLIALADQEFGEIRTILTGDAGDECSLHMDAAETVRPRFPDGSATGSWTDLKYLHAPPPNTTRRCPLPPCTGSRIRPPPESSHIT